MAKHQASPKSADGAQNQAAHHVTPMMAQYIGIRDANPGYLLFYRMGDFYELFFDDAVKASQALDITLTNRGKHDGQDVPMCGVPVQAAETYLQRLIRAGFKVAVCEQMENPAEARKRGPKAVVERQVVRLVTAGTLTEDALLDARAANYLAAIGQAEGRLALAWTDMSTGEFAVREVDAHSMDAALAQLQPGEILVPERLAAEKDSAPFGPDWQDVLSPQAGQLFSSDAGARRLKSLYGLAALDALGLFSRAALSAAGAVVEYLSITQKGQLPHLGRLVLIADGSTMAIDPATRRNLELTTTSSGDYKGSLLSVIDHTVTGAGARLMRRRLAAPLMDVRQITRRLDQVGYFVGQDQVREKLRGVLRQTADIERAQSRISVERGGPRDLVAIRDTLAAIPQIRTVVLDRIELAPANEILTDLLGALGEHTALVDLLRSALGERVPVLIRDGGFVARGFDAKLDELITLRDESKRLIANLEARYRHETGVGALKIRHNNVLGYFVEVPPKRAEEIGEGFIHRQTLASAVRYGTVELGEFEARIRSAAEQALALELRIFSELSQAVLEHADAILGTARALAALDVVSALAELAVSRRYCRPEVEDDRSFEIVGGRHAVVEAFAFSGAPQGEQQSFVPNDCDLAEDNRVWLITGPNMAGKSTFLRQNALITVLAQMGSFVPAERARIGLVDRLFSRVGAADDLARGRSTFMVEMIESAAILNQAGPRALVILDEIGRGTATYDGLSIAWAAVEHLHDTNGCRALFATHYHELTALASKLDGLACHTMRVKEWRGDVVFLHEVTQGTADRSYGIHVARLAGLPERVLSRAEQILKILEEGEHAGSLARLADDLPLFAALPTPTAASDPLREALDALDPDSLSPRDALELIYRLRAMVEDA